MPKYVQVEGGPRVAFPDDATEQEITSTLNRDYPPEPAPVQGMARPPQFNYDDNLARAARDFEGLKSVGMVGNERPAPPSGAAVAIGKGFANASQAIKASLADAGEKMVGPALAKVFGQPDAGEPPSNIEAFANNQPLPAETQLRVLPKPLQVAGRAAQGLVGSAPQMAAVMGAEAAGIPPFASAPVIFGSTPEGFSPEQAAIATALPFVGRYGGEIAGALSRRLGVSSSQAENIFKGLGGSTAAAAYLATIDASQIAGLPEDEKHAAMIDSVASVFSQMALGPMGVKFRQPGAGEVAGQLLAKSVSGATDFGIEGEAAAGGVPLRTPGAPEMRIEGVPPEFTPAKLNRLGQAPRGARAAVTEGEPAEERVSAVEEIRRAGARTIRQIQELFPKAQLSREQARAWRTAAWGSPEQVERTTAPAGGEPTGAEPAPPDETPGLGTPPPVGEPEPTGVDRFEQQYEVGKNNDFSQQVGLELGSIEDLDRMLEHRRNAVAVANRWEAKANAETDPQRKEEAIQAWINAQPRGSLAREAIEVATNSGSWVEGQGGLKVGARPLDWQSNPKVAAWLKAHAEEAGITLPAELQPKAPIGAEFSASIPAGGSQVRGNYDVVNATDITTSQDLGFDPALQPRDRSRVASQQQIASIVRNFEPQRLGGSVTTDLGAPIIDEHGQVLSGNGRTQAIRQKYFANQGQDYKTWLVNNAQDFGLDPEAVAKMERPMLVRRVTDFGELTKAEFARQSNQQQVAGMSEAEKAANDAKMLGSARGLMDLFRPGPNGEVLAASNREFLNAFIKGTGDQNELLSKEGYNGAALTKRVRNAVLGALIGPENRTLLDQLLEGADRLNLRTAVNGVMASAPALMRFKGTPYDLSSLASQAFKDLVSLRSTGQKLEEFLDDRPLLTDDARTAESDLLLKFLAQTRSAKAVSEGLARYAGGAREALQDLESGGMLGTKPATRGELIERAANAQSQPPGAPDATQPELTPSSGAAAGAPGAESPGQPESPPGQPGPEPGAEGPAAGQGAASPPFWTKVASDLFRNESNTVRLAKRGSRWYLTIARTIGGDLEESFGTRKKAEAWLKERHPEWFSPPPSSQEGGARTPPGPRQAPSLALNEAYDLNPAEMATQSADANLRGAQQRNNAPLNQAGQALTGAAAGQQPGRRWFSGLRRIFAAGTLSDDAGIMAGIVRHALGQEYASGRQADAALRTWRAEFDRTPVGRNFKFVPGLALPRNYEVMRAIDTGDFGALTPLETDFARTMRGLFDEAIDLVHSVSPESLRNLVENYFPRIWQDPVGNADRINQLLSRRPWEGPKSFLRKRVLEYFTDGLALGLKPVSDNPVDVALHKLGEMYRFVATRRAMEEAKARGLRKFVYIYERAPAGWREVADPSSKVWAPPTVTVKEAFDAQVRAKTLELLEQLGVPHQRLVNIGGRRWGYAEPGTGKIVSKFGGPDAVLWHEFGHQMDWRYPELRDLLPMKGNSTLAKELRDLADLRFEGQNPSQGYRDYVRQAEEKMANVFDAYIRAPARFQETAPNVWRVFNDFLDNHPELRNPLDEIRPSLTLGVGTAEMFVGGPVALGRWMMPEGAAQVVDNYLQPGLGKFKAFRTLREVSGLVNGIQLAGFFHGGFVLNDSFYSGIGLALYDGLQGVKDAFHGDLGKAAEKFIRGGKEVMLIPSSPLASFFRGGRIKSAIENPDALPERPLGGLIQRTIKGVTSVPDKVFAAVENRARFGGDVAAANRHYAELARLAVEQNLRAGHGNFDPEFARRWNRAFHEALSQPSIGAAWETFWRTPMAFVQGLMKPVMDHLVPRMKLGIYARMAERVIADNPNASELEIRRQLALAADATEDRLGQVTYDNLFQARTVKDAMQLGMRAYGWQLTKYRLIFGGAGDWVRAGRALAGGQAPEVTFRMTYLPAMAIGHAVLGGILQYALTGRRPAKLIDYMFPETGLVDAFGQPVRVAIADFVKDVVADFRSFPHVGKMTAEFSRKLAPFWNMAAEMYRNQDFWGTEIFTRKQLGEPELDHVMRNIWEGIQYTAKSVLPFSVRGAQRLEQSGATKVGMLGPMVGLVPAPRYATQTAAETRSSEIMREMLPKQAQSKEQAARGVAEAAIIRDIRTGKINQEGEFEARAKAAGINFRDQRELTKLRERVLWSPLQYQVHKMGLKQAMEEIFDLANDQERVTLAPVLAQKINNAFEAGRIDGPTAKRYVALVMPFYKRARSAPRPAAPAAARANYSAFSPTNR